MDDIIRRNKKAIKRNVNYVALGLILYTIILYGTVFLDILISMIMILIVYFDNPILQEQATQELMDSLMTDGTSSIIAVVIGVFFMYLFFWKRITIRDITKSEKKMSALTFVGLVCIFMLCQRAFSFVATFLECGLNLFGYSSMSSMESATSVSTTVSMFLYASFFGPVAEELVYRGFVLRSLEKYGKTLAIVVSAVLFAIMHANLPQSIFAFGVGLVLGYVAVEYSMGWAMALHIVNNCVFSDLMGMAVASLSETMQSIFSYGVMIALAIPGAVILWKNRSVIKNYCIENKSEKKMYQYIFLSIGMVIFIAANLAMALIGLEKI